MSVSHIIVHECDYIFSIMNIHYQEINYLYCNIYLSYPVSLKTLFSISFYLKNSALKKVKNRKEKQKFFLLHDHHFKSTERKNRNFKELKLATWNCLDMLTKASCASSWVASYWYWLMRISSELLMLSTSVKIKGDQETVFAMVAAVLWLGIF